MLDPPNLPLMSDVRTAAETVPHFVVGLKSLKYHSNKFFN